MINTEVIKCHQCGKIISRDNSYFLDGQIFCEDCCLNKNFRVQACDPFAARAAEKFRSLSGNETTGGLTTLQKEIYEYIRIKERTTFTELSSHFKIPDKELENQLAILRHCSLVRGTKEGKRVYLLPFKTG